MTVVGYDISDERTQAQPINASFDARNEDVVFLALRGPDQGTRFLVKRPGGIVGRESGVVLGDPPLTSNS